MIQVCHQIIHWDLGGTYYKITITEKIKTINNKIKQNKAQYNLDRHTAKISVLSLGNVSKYDFLTGKDALLERGLLKKLLQSKERFKYSSLGNELRKQTSVAEKQY